jgi:hypothetical protein
MLEKFIKNEINYSRHMRYQSINITFPEYYADSGLTLPHIPEGELHQNGIRFSTGGALHHIYTGTHQIPESLWDHEAVRREVIVPAMAEVNADLETIKGLMPELKRFMVCRGAYPQYSFFVGRSPDEFRIYDYATSSSGSPTEMALRLQGVSPRYLVPEARQVSELAKHIDRYDESHPFMVGSTLHEAASRLIALYRATSILESNQKSN